MFLLSVVSDNMHLSWKSAFFSVIVAIAVCWLVNRILSSIVDENEMSTKSFELQNEPGVFYTTELGPTAKLQPSVYPDVKTLYDCLHRGRRVAQKHGDQRMLGRYVDGKYEWLTYDEVIKQAEILSSGLINFGLKPGQDTRIAIFSVNCVEWMIAFLACMLQNIVLVPINRYLHDEGITHILNQCDIEILFVKDVSDATKLQPLFSHCPQLKTIVVFDGIPDDFQRNHMNYLSLKELEEIGRKHTVPLNPPSEKDIVNICYTSGSTGMPKGAIITHSMVIATISSFAQIHKPVAVEGEEVLISYLPLAHIFGFVAECICITEGYKIGYFSGNIKEFTRDIQALRPTFLPAVPKVINSIYDRVQAQLRTAGNLKRFVFGVAVKRKIAFMQRTGSYRHSVYDRYLFSKIRKILGDRVRFVIIGGAASRPTVVKFMKTVLGCAVVEGYGQTETCSGTICQRTSDLTVGNVGSPLICLQVKLVPTEEQVQKGKNVGEICVRGYNVTPGYFRYTEEGTFDEQGWLHTGDIACRNPDGSFSIVDRRKEIFKLSQGEYISPAKVEHCYSGLPVISQIFVTGLPETSFCVAVVVPEENVLRSKLEELGVQNAREIPLSQLCAMKQATDYIFDEMCKQAKEAKLSGVERVCRICLEPTPFSIDNGLLTPTFKVRRSVASRHFKSQIEMLYDDN